MASKAAVRCASSSSVLARGVGITPGKDDAGTLGAGSPGGFQPDTGAAADDHDGLADEFRFAPGGNGRGRRFLRRVVRTTVTTG